MCPKCGFANAPSHKFCGECGHNLSIPSKLILSELSFDEKLKKKQRYLPGGLTEKVLAQRRKIEGERKQVTVMFCDMEGFTPLVAKAGPEEAYTIMDAVYEILIHKVHDYEGTVNEMTGDGIIALFGAPIALEDAPQRAIRSAYAIHREMTRFTETLKKERTGTQPIKMRIGIHTGPVIVGTLGNDLRVEFKAVGDTVNLASRVEGLAESGTTYVTEETFKLTEGLFRFEAMGEREIKGKDEPVNVYRIISPSSLSTRFEVNAERGLTPFTGRERELELLLDGFERAKAGRGNVFSILAEAGVGKTRLLYEFRKAVANENVTIREGRCLSYSQSKTYYPIIDILKSNFDIREGDGDIEIREKIHRNLKIIKADESSTLPYLAGLLSVKESGVDEISISPEEKKVRFMEALKRIVLKSSEIRPVIMAIEDLHWIDNSSEEVLKDLFESIAGSRVLLIFTYRPEFVHTWGGRSYHNQLNLNRLSNRESLGVVSHLLNTTELDNDLEDLILEKSEGIPFFIEELVKSLKDLKIIEKNENIVGLTKNAQNLVIPSTIHDVIMTRVDPLPWSVKEVLQTGAVIGREFSYDLIKKVADLSGQELISQLSALKDSELVYERGIYPQSTYIFKHALTREVVYDSILIVRKKKLHEAIGHAIEELYSVRLEEFYEMLAYHYSESENLEKAYQYLKLSAEKVLSVYAYEEAVRLLEKALKVQKIMDPEGKEKRCDLLLALCESLLMAGKARRLLDTEAPAGFSMAETIGDSEQASRFCYLAMEALRYYGAGPGFYTPEAVKWAERAARHAEPDTLECAWGDMAMGVVKYATGHPSEGFVFLNQALDLARRLGNADTFWSAAGSWIRYVEAPQHNDERLRLAEEFMARPRAGAGMKSLTTALIRICYAFLDSGQRQRAEEVASEVRILAERTGQANILLLSMFLDSIFVVLDGHLEDAMETSRRIAARGRRLGLVEFGLVHAGLAGLRPRLHLGVAEGTLRRIAQSQASLPNRVLCLAYLGQDAEVTKTLYQLVLERPNFGSTEDETAAWADILLLEAAVLVRHREAVARLLCRLGKSSVRTTGPYHITIVARHLGAGAVLLSKHDEARAHYQVAMQLANEMRFRPEIALTRLHLAELLLEHYPEDGTEALEHLNFAVAEFRNMKMAPALQRALRYEDILLK